MKPTYLINLSGGLDSLYTLWRFLQEFPEDAVLTHHIRIDLSTKRNYFERKAVRAQLDWVKANGFSHRVSHVETRFGVGSLATRPYDISLTGLYMGLILSDQKGKTIHTYIRSSPLEDTERNGQAAISLRRELQLRLMKVHCKRPIREINFMEALTKKQAYDQLPEDLKKLWFSCRKPSLEGVICEKCHSCKHNNFK